jgi:hypothetical protein
MCPGYVVAQLVKALRYKAEGCGFDYRSFRPHYGPEVDSTSNGNE